MRILKDFLWISRRILIEGAVCLSVFYFFVLRWEYQRRSTGQSLVEFAKAVFFFTADKSDWVTWCFYATWTFHWFYFWVRIRGHVYYKHAEKGLKASTWGFGVVVLMLISRLLISANSYCWFLDRVFEPALIFFVCGSFPFLLAVNFYLWVCHCLSQAPAAKPEPPPKKTAPPECNCGCRRIRPQGNSDEIMEPMAIKEKFEKLML